MLPGKQDSKPWTVVTSFLEKTSLLCASENHGHQTIASTWYHRSVQSQVNPFRTEVCFLILELHHEWVRAQSMRIYSLSVQAPWGSGVKPLYIGPFCPLGIFQGTPWAWVSLQEVGNESGKLEFYPFCGFQVPPTVTLITSGGGLGFGTEQWPWWEGSALSPESTQEAVILCWNHTSLGDCRLRIPVSWTTGYYCSQSQYCQGVNGVQHRSGKGLTTAEKPLLC